MPTIEERIAYLEGRLRARVGAADTTQQDIRNLRALVESLNQKVDRQFIWTVGIQVAVLLAVVGALAR